MLRKVEGATGGRAKAVMVRSAAAVGIEVQMRKAQECAVFGRLCDGDGLDLRAAYVVLTVVASTCQWFLITTC